MANIGRPPPDTTLTPSRGGLESIGEEIAPHELGTQPLEVTSRVRLLRPVASSLPIVDGQACDSWWREDQTSPRLTLRAGCLYSLRCREELFSETLIQQGATLPNRTEAKGRCIP